MKLAIAGVLCASLAYADKPTLVAVAPAPDARQTIALGPGGQAYEPDGKGAWTRTRAGGTANEIVAAARAGAAIFVGSASGPPFKLVDGVWSAVRLGQRGHAILGAGSRTTAAIGRAVFALDGALPQKLADAPNAVLGLAASSGNLVIAIDGGLFRIDHGWKPIQGAPPSVIRFLSDQWALVEHGAFDLRNGKTIAWPADVSVVAAAVTPDNQTVIAAATHDTSVELLTVRAGKLDREPIALTSASEIIGLVIDRDGRVVVASRDGHLAIRDRGAWTTATVGDALPPPHPGPAPAISH